MRIPFVVGALVALLSPLAAFGQQPRAKVVRTEIYNGGQLTVRYNTPGLATSEAHSLREVERLENEAIYLRELNDLKREYVRSERLLEPQRLIAQRSAYGFDPATYAYSPASIPVALLNRPFGFAGFGAFGNVGTYGFGGYPTALYAPAAFAAPLATQNAGFGMVDDGAMKASMAKAISAQLSPEYAASIDRSYDRALARVSSKEAQLAISGGIVPVADAGERQSAVLTLKSGEEVRGVKYEEKGAWFIVTQAGGRTVRVRESEVVRVESGSGSGAIKPAS